MGDMFTRSSTAIVVELIGLLVPMQYHIYYQHTKDPTDV